MSAKDEPKSGDQRRLVSVLYANILGFASLADQLEPGVTSRLMGDLWDELKQIILEFGGLIDTQLGDSFLVVWGTPEILEDYEFVESIRNIIIDGANLEFTYLKSKFSGSTIFGLSYNELEHYLKYITDRRMEELGFEPAYYVDENPLKFLQKEDVKKLTNFFEVSSTEYTNF